MRSSVCNVVTFDFSDCWCPNKLNHWVVENSNTVANPRPNLVAASVDSINGPCALASHSLEWQFEASQNHFIPALQSIRTDCVSVLHTLYCTRSAELEDNKMIQQTSTNVFSCLLIFNQRRLAQKEKLKTRGGDFQ